MPRPILKPAKTETHSDRLSAVKQGREIDSMKLDRLLRAPRSKEYMEAIQKLDVGAGMHNLEIAEKAAEAVNKEFQEPAVLDILLGFIAKCYLGFPYEVHTLDLSGRIITHFKAGEALPSGMDKARGIAIRGGYAFIEVYTDCCRAVSEDGSVSVIK